MGSSHRGKGQAAQAATGCGRQRIADSRRRSSRSKPACPAGGGVTSQHFDQYLRWDGKGWCKWLKRPEDATMPELRRGGADLGDG